MHPSIRQDLIVNAPEREACSENGPNPKMQEMEKLCTDLLAEQERQAKTITDLSQFYEKRLDSANEEHAEALAIALQQNDHTMAQVHEEYQDLVKTLISQHEVFLTDLKCEFNSVAVVSTFEGQSKLLVTFQSEQNF